MNNRHRPFPTSCRPTSNGNVPRAGAITLNWRRKTMADCCSSRGGEDKAGLQHSPNRRQSETLYYWAGDVGNHFFPCRTESPNAIVGQSSSLVCVREGDRYAILLPFSPFVQERDIPGGQLPSRTPPQRFEAGAREMAARMDWEETVTLVGLLYAEGGTPTPRVWDGGGRRGASVTG